LLSHKKYFWRKCGLAIKIIPIKQHIKHVKSIFRYFSLKKIKENNPVQKGYVKVKVSTSDKGNNVIEQNQNAALIEPNKALKFSKS